MENPHVKIGILCLVPETTSFYVQACICGDIGGSVSESLAAQRLQRGFCCNIMTDFCQKLGCHVGFQYVSELGNCLSCRSWHD